MRSITQWPALRRLSLTVVSAMALAGDRSKRSSATGWLRIAGLIVVLLAPAAAEARGGQQWFSAWTVSHNTRVTTPALSGSTVRMIVRPTISGSALRVKLENTLGQTPVVFSAAYVGVVDSGAALVPGSNTQLTFGGSAGLTLAPGAGAYSDPVAFHVLAFQRLAVSLDVVSASDISVHVVGLTTNYFAPGARAADTSAAGFAPVPEIPALNSGQWPFYWVASVDVQSPSTTGTVVAFGDSITDGRCSTRDANGIVHPDLYLRWGDVLSERIAALPANQSKAIANEGIAGNRVVSGGNGPPALDRMDRDVLDRAGITHIIFFEGTNDITGGATAATVIAGTQQVIDRAHAQDLSIIGVTVIPRGRPAPMTGWTTSFEQQRLAVNAWMRTQANFDNLIDFDALMQGPVVQLSDGGFAPSIRPDWNCDFTHPNTAGYNAMGEFIDLGMFENIGTWGNGH
jgi:lysophospholipase L1-like esterase